MALEQAGDYLACGEGYEQLAGTDGDEFSQPDELLYNAGVCFEEANLVGRATVVYTRLIRRFPASFIARRAMIRMASAYAAVGEVGAAATWYESYAKRYGGEKDAPAALVSAMVYRRALGDYKAARADGERFLKYYNTRLREESAEVLFGLARMYEEAGDAHAASQGYKRYIKEMGSAGGADRLLIANARAGEIAWQASCAHPSSDGSCLRVKRKPAGGTSSKLERCGPESIVELLPRPRDAAAIAEARGFFLKVVALGRAGALDKIEEEARQATALYWLNASSFYLIESRFEAFFGLVLPADLDLASRDAKLQAESKERFAAFMDQAESEMKLMLVDYEKIRSVVGGGGHWAIASAARVGQLTEHFRDILLTARVPTGMQRGSEGPVHTDAYCGEMSAVAAPMEDLAVAAYSFCLELSKNLDLSNSWTKRCESSLFQLRPDQFPMASESHDTHGLSGELIDRVGLLPEERSRRAE